MIKNATSDLIYDMMDIFSLKTLFRENIVLFYVRGTKIMNCTYKLFSFSLFSKKISIKFQASRNIL